MHTIRICLLLTALFAACSATAHHAATGRYDPDLVGVVEGEITEIFWRNPHVRMLLQRTADNVYPSLRADIFRVWVPVGFGNRGAGDTGYPLSEDGTDLSWYARITDPVNYSEPVIMEHAWTWLPGHEVKPYNCELRPDR